MTNISWAIMSKKEYDIGSNLLAQSFVDRSGVTARSHRPQRGDALDDACFVECQSLIGNGPTLGHTIGQRDTL